MEPITLSIGGVFGDFTVVRPNDGLKELANISYNIPYCEYTKFKYYVWLIALSSVTHPPIVMSLEFFLTNDFVNHSINNSSIISNLMRRR